MYDFGGSQVKECDYLRRWFSNYCSADGAPLDGNFCRESNKSYFGKLSTNKTSFIKVVFLNLYCSIAIFYTSTTVLSF